MISARTIIRVVAKHYNMTRDQMLAKTRKPSFAQPRQVAMLLVRTITGLSYPAIGREFRRDHSSVMHGCSLIEEELTACLVLQRDVAAIRQRLSTMPHVDACPHCGEALEPDQKERAA